MYTPTMMNLVVREDESVTRGFGSSYIPTLGLPASTFDVYRTVAIDHVIDKPPSWSIIDVDAAEALGRIIDGPIISYEDIENAESALRAILLYEFTEVLVPCIKYGNDHGLFSYLRSDHNKRNEASFLALRNTNCRDLLIAAEFISVADNKITTSSNPSSAFVGQPIESIASHYDELYQFVTEIATTFPMAIGAATHYTNKAFTTATQNGIVSFIDQLYKRIYRPWMEIAQSQPPLDLNVKLPPLVAILLSRSPKREDIPTVLIELREELEMARKELNTMNSMLDSSVSQAEIIAQVKKLNESYDAIVPESLLTKAERRWRCIASIYNFIKPIKQLYSLAVDPLTVDQQKMVETFNNIHSAVKSSSRIVSRSVSAATLAEMLRVDSVRDMILSHFTKSEKDLLIKSNI